MIFLGVDCGTQSTKTVALDGDTGKIIASAAEAYDLIPGLPPGHMEQHPSTWVDAMEKTVARVLDELGPRRGEVRGMGVSGQQHGFVPLDKDAQVIRPAKLWNDTSTAAECDLFREHFGGASYFIERTGLDMLPGYTAPKILWLKRHEPENFAKLATALLPHDHLNFHLTGNFRMEYGDASGTALLNIRSGEWERDILEFIDASLPSKMPPVRSSREPAGTLLPKLASRWNLPREVVVSAGGGDNMMGAIGTANIAPGRVAASLGTSGTIYAYSEKPLIDTKGEIAGFRDSTDAWLPLVCTMNVTVATEAARKLFGLSHAQFDAAVESAPAGSGGLLFLPYLEGERTPNLPGASGVFHGLTTRTMQPAFISRAVMEGATLGLAYGLERMRELGISPSEIRLIGGGSHSAAWRQICADVFRCPVVTLAEAEGAAFGAAIQALAAVQTGAPVNDWSSRLVQTNPREAAHPDEKISSRYAGALQKHTSLMRALAGNHFL